MSVLQGAGADYSILYSHRVALKLEELKTHGTLPMLTEELNSLSKKTTEFTESI